MTVRPLSMRVRRTLLAGALTLSGMVLVPGAADAAPDGGGRGHDRSCERQVNNTYQKLLRCVGADSAWEHLEAFQAIADANGDTRASATPGYDASADYVAGVLEDAGYLVTRQVFDFPFFEETQPAELEQLTPVAATYETGTFEFSGGGTVEGQVIPVDLNLVGDRASSSGCEAEDFTGLDFSGDADIALIQRGTCTFGSKALNAQLAGAEAVVIFNQGTAGRTDLIVGTLGDESADVIEIPVVGASFDDGVALSQPGSTARVFTEVFLEFRTTENVIADSRHGNPDNVVISGAHLDSVLAGPGINDNGSGSAALLSTAVAMAKVRPENQLRFAWWGAEESGLIGSQRYVDTLTRQERNDVEAYLNFDMVGSPNFVRFVYDGDGSAFGVKGPSGSGHIEATFVDFFASLGLESEPTEFDGRSDYDAFINAGIPAGGLFTGAEGIKTEEQAAIYGGTAGVAYDPCYHLACDTYDNNSDVGLDQMSDAIAHAPLVYAMTTSSVNGIGKASGQAATAQSEFHGTHRIR